MNVKTLCLGILKLRDAIGYEIKKLSTEGHFKHFIEASFASIYPTLSKMEKDGLVSVKFEQQLGKPDKKIYSITDKGLIEFTASLEEDPAEDKFKSEFLFLMLYSKMLPEERISRLIDERLQRLKSDISGFQEKLNDCDEPGARFTLGMGLKCKKAELDYILEHRGLVEQSRFDTLNNVAAE